jgi:hypothetical protein
MACPLGPLGLGNDPVVQFRPPSVVFAISGSDDWSYPVAMHVVVDGHATALSRCTVVGTVPNVSGPLAPAGGVTDVTHPTTATSTALAIAPNRFAFDTRAPRDRPREPVARRDLRSARLTLGCSSTAVAPP